MANVLFVEGWGLTGDLVDSTSALTPDKLGAVGWLQSRGSASTGQATVSLTKAARAVINSASTNTGTGVSLFRALNAVSATLVVGWAANDNWQSASDVGPGLFLRAGAISEPAANAQVTADAAVWVKRASNGEMTIFCQDAGTVTSSTPVVPLFISGVDNWVELVVDRAGQEARLYLNNAQISTLVLPASLAALTSAAFGLVVSAQVSNLSGFNGQINVGHAYVADERLGRCQVIPVFPTADVAVDFARTQGDSNASQVADRDGPDGDASYVRSAQTGEEDRYSSSDAVNLTNERIHAVAVTVSGRKEDVGLRSLTPLIRQGASPALGSAVPLEVSTYRGGQSVFSVDPATSATWTLAGVEAATFGVRLTE